MKDLFTEKDINVETDFDFQIIDIGTEEGIIDFLNIITGRVIEVNHCIYPSKYTEFIECSKKDKSFELFDVVKEDLYKSFRRFSLQNGATNVRLEQDCLIQGECNNLIADIIGIRVQFIEIYYKNDDYVDFIEHNPKVEIIKDRYISLDEHKRDFSMRNEVK